MSAAGEQWNWGLGLRAEEFRTRVGLECPNGLKLDHSGCLNTCIFHIENIPEKHR